MSAILLLLIINYSSVDSTSDIHSKIPVFEWEYLIKNSHLIDKNVPFLIRNSPSKTWQLFKNAKLIQNLEFIFNDYGDCSFEFKTANCSCFENNNYNLCQHYVNSHTYYSKNIQKKFGKRNESIWYKYEINHNENIRNKQCINYSKRWNECKQIVNQIKMYNANNLNKDMFSQSSLSFSFKIMEQNEFTSQLYIDQVSMNFFSLISLDEVFNLLSLNNRFNDLSSIHLWFGTNNYRTKFHFDYNDNIFFMLNGYKIFLLSPPSLNKFNLFPFLHESERQSETNITISNIIYKVKVESGDALWLPSFWFHEVINGGYGFNLWILDKTLNTNLHNIEHYKYPTFINKIFKKSIKKKNFDEIMYFINILQSRFCAEISEKCDINKGLMMSYFGKIYPILSDIQNFHLFIGNNMKIKNNLKWLDWFINFSDILKCNDINYTEKKLFYLRKLFYQRSYTLTCNKQNNNVFQHVIDEIILFLFEIKQLKDEQVATIVLATFIERVLYKTINDVQFTPLIIALYVL